LFGPDSMTWRINRESVLLLGGRATLLMQLAHPLVAAGVADHSNFRTDPIDRLKRTMDTMLSIVFGDRASAERIVTGVNAVHDHVTGRGADGRPYSARDPHLMLWVHATLVDSSVTMYEACVKTLTEAERARYYEETAVVARLFGIPEAIRPDTLEGLRAWMDELIETKEVTVTPLAREVAAPIIRPLRIIPRRLAESSAVVTAALLPPPIRDGYGLKTGRTRAGLLALGRGASRLVVPRLPGPVRQWPVARAAARR
jgi:uncharacterized protein (DUF2236 family)